MIGHRYGVARYRTRQFLRALQERPDRSSRRLVDDYLNASARSLFGGLSPRDQQHSARTAALILQAGDNDPELIVAALLHDIGKGQQRLWQRILYVLLAALSPRLLARFARPGAGWRGALDRAARHPALGAELTRAAGYSDRVAQLVAAHHRQTASGDLLALQRADERA
jgi:putative nucleotidyltransferase with HDIG domain